MGSLTATTACEHQALSKRSLILELVRAALAAGATPEALIPILPRGASRWFFVEGTVGEVELVERMCSMQTPRGGSYEPHRFFVDDKSLFHVGGRTYAFSNQWGDEGWRAAVRTIIAAYPQLEASYRRTDKA